MEFRILGALEVVDGSRLVDVGAAAKKKLLAVLLLHPNQVVSVDRLVDDLWGEDPPPGARGTLQTYISALRKGLEPEARGGAYRWVITRAPGYLLQLERPDQLDAARFEALVAAGRRRLDEDDFTGASAVLGEALALWRGPALADFSYEAFAEVEAARLEEARLAALEDRLEAELRVGRHGELAGELEALVRQHPLREGFWRQLMLALYRGGRPAEALRAYQRLRAYLADELGLDPSPELQQLEAAMLRQDDSLVLPPPPRPTVPTVRAGVPAEEAPAAPAPKLPTPVSSFVGRDFERREVRKLIGRERLVTLTGAGGCGKTRLAIAVATELAEQFPDGVWFADLARTADPALVPQALAIAVGVPELPGRAILDTLTDALRSKSALLVMDNCEHLTVAVARTGDALLQACPGLRILATSRELLGIPGETIFRVPSLSLPPEPAPPECLGDYEAVRLFVERTAAIHPKFEVNQDNAAAVASICARLDGIPLAIELAAARTAALTPRQIAARLDDRFRLLVAGNRAAMPRHQTLLATLEWSYQLLGTGEQTLLQRLAVFAAGFTIDAAEAVAADGVLDHREVFPLLAQLVDKSLVVAEPDSDEARYRLLETIRAFAGEQLRASGDEDATRDRHLRWYTAVAQEAEAGFEGPRQAEWLTRLETDHADLQHALSWAIEHRPGEPSLRLAAALLRFWEAGGHWGEGRRSLDAALRGLAEAPPALQGKALWAAGQLALHQDDHEAARRHVEASLAIYRELSDASGTGRALNVLGGLAMNAEDLATAASHFEAALTTYRQAGEVGGIARSLNNLGIAARRRSDHATAAARFAEALPMFRELGDRVGIGNCLNNLGLVRFSQGNYPTAHALIEEALALSAPGDRQQRAGRLESLARVATGEGDGKLARSCYLESLQLSHDLGSQELIAFCLEGLGWVAVDGGDHRRAARLRGAAEALRESVGCPLPEVDRPRYERDVAALRVALGEEAFEAAWTEGRSMTVEEAFAYATEDRGDAVRVHLMTSGTTRGTAGRPETTGKKEE